MNKKNLLLFFSIIIITFILKYPYLSEIYGRNDMFYKLLIFHTNNTYINIIWLIPIISNILFITNEYYNKLINFDVRYKNRTYYLVKTLWESLIKHFFLSCIAILTQWFIFLVITNTKILLNEIVFCIFLKYIFEIYLIEIIIIIIALLIDNYIYSFISSLVLTLILIISNRSFYIPFITLFYDYRFNLFSIFILILSFFTIIILYNKIDLGGIKYEINN